MLDFERDINQAKSGLANDLVYKTLVGLKSDLSGTVQQPEILGSNVTECSENEGSDNSEQDDSEGNSDEESKFVDSSRPKHESLEEKKARKKAVKEAQADKRKVKVKKHIKKQKERKIKK